MDWSTGVIASPRLTLPPLAAGGRELSMEPGKGTTFVRYDAELRRDSMQHAVAHLRVTLFDSVSRKTS
jgi:hypothetical protein